MKFIILGSKEGKFAVNPARVVFVMERDGKTVVTYTELDGSDCEAIYNGLFHQAVADLNGD